MIRPSARRRRPHPAIQAAAFDTLEGRTLFATFVVNTIADDGAGSLREAIFKANQTDAADTITFNIPGGGVKTIAPKSALPVIAKRVTIDATTQPGYAAGSPKVVIDGAVAASLDPMNDDIDGLEIDANKCEVRGLAVGNFSGDGIELRASEAKVRACFVGTDATGLAAMPNGHAGVRITDSTKNTIGGTSAEDRNVISGNTEAGVSVRGAGSGDNTISGNYIGLGVDGKTAVPNQHGIAFFAAAHDNTVGGSTAGARNVISGNAGDGINISGEGTTGTRVRGNYIGIDAAGGIAVGNGSRGVGIGLDADDVTIGGDTPARRNVISGNVVGIGIGGEDGVSEDVRIYGNYIGTTPDGLSAIPNTDGIGIGYGGAGILIGGTDAGEGNLISGNTHDGIGINSIHHMRIEGNYIGVDATGDAPLGNGSTGLYADGAFKFQDGFVRNNVISANGFRGIFITAGGGGGSRNVIQGNFIGTNRDGTVAMGNASHGLEITGVKNLIGGTEAGQGNVISANGGDGLILYHTNGYSEEFMCNDNQILGNKIGTDITGKLDFGNGGNGIRLETYETADEDTSLRRTNIGDGTSAGRNVISGNGAAGVLMEGMATSETRLFGNYIGTDVTGKVAIPNDIGVNVHTNANQNRIGGEKAGQGNVISGNNGQGVVFGSGAFGNTVRGNRIGTSVDGKSLGNGASGVLFEQTASAWNVIGYEEAGGANTIAFNGGAGIRVFGGSGEMFLRNSIFSNAEIGIDLGPLTGVTPNDALLDSDVGPNGLQNYPTLSSAVHDGTSLQVTGSLYSAANSTFVIQLFSDTVRAASAAEGRNFLGRIKVQTNALGIARFTVSLPTDTPGTHVTALAMSSFSGNTSEFSAAVGVTKG